MFPSLLLKSTLTTPNSVYILLDAATNQFSLELHNSIDQFIIGLVFMVIFVIALGVGLRVKDNNDILGYVLAFNNLE